MNTAMGYCLKCPMPDMYRDLKTSSHFLSIIPSIGSNRPLKSIPTIASRLAIGYQVLCKVLHSYRPPYASS